MQRMVGVLWRWQHSEKAGWEGLGKNEGRGHVVVTMLIFQDFRPSLNTWIPCLLIIALPHE